MERLSPDLPARRVLDRARRSRDPRFDGRFFVGVTSTGVYCRPVCPAPAPKDAHVRYFASAAAAAAAGFRPCLRCRPEAAPGTPAWLGASAVVRRALRLIDEGALDEASVDTLASRVGIGPRHLDRLFLAHVGAPPVAIAQTRRLHFAKRLLDETDLSMTDVALASGYGSLRRFNHAFATTYGRPPSALRRACPERSRRACPERSRRAAPGELTLRLAFRPPYDFQGILRFLAARAVPGLERVDAAGYARTLDLPSGPAAVRVRAVPGTAALELRVRGAPATALFQLTVDAHRCFDLAADPARIAAALRADPALRPLVRRRPGLRIPGAWDPCECVVRAILGQQVSVAAARTLATRLVLRAGASLPAPSDGLTHLFPSPTVLAAADLAGLGLTGARANAIRTFARAVADRRIDLRAAPADVAAALVALPGLGEWTAQYVALRALGEPDAFPAGDLVLRRAVGGRVLPSPRTLAARAEAWRPWRGYAVFHLWTKEG
ncbi:MAG: DNA-3-methyladenine glycosylase 2 family protein [Deltaproteobacteria bacterium]|nr:DNA-3-methyladenine glycosylase 2 family protein [Deltaproteobacteria bacterium]